jgi:hypothetical protein
VQFKLKAPQTAIAGSSFFGGFSVLPDWVRAGRSRVCCGITHLQEMLEPSTLCEIAQALDTSDPALLTREESFLDSAEPFRPIERSRQRCHAAHSLASTTTKVAPEPDAGR